MNKEDVKALYQSLIEEGLSPAEILSGVLYGLNEVQQQQIQTPADRLGFEPFDYSERS